MITKAITVSIFIISVKINEFVIWHECEKYVNIGTDY